MTSAHSSNQAAVAAPPAPVAPANGNRPGYVIGGPDQPCNIEHVIHLLPHRYPFLLIDRIKSAGWMEIVALKNVSINEPYFAGHFPGHPVMPGVLILEALAQAGCVLLANRTNGRKLMYLAGVDHARFKRTVVPGDVLELRVQILQERRKLGKARGEAWVDDKMVAEAEILFADAEA